MRAAPSVQELGVTEPGEEGLDVAPSNPPAPPLVLVDDRLDQLVERQVLGQQLEQPRADARDREVPGARQASDLRKLSSGKPLTSYIAQAELCKRCLNSASYLLTGQFNM